MSERETSCRQEPPASEAKPSSFAGDVFKLAGSTTVGQVIVVLASPILARLYAPEAFGTAGVFASILAIVTVVVCLRYERAIMLPREEEKSAQLAVGSLGIAAFVTALTIVGVVLWGEVIGDWLNAPELVPHLWLLPLAVLAIGVGLVLRYWNTRKKEFGLLSVAQVAKSATAQASALGAGLLQFSGPGPLIGSATAGWIVSSTLLGLRVSPQDRKLLSQVRWRSILASLKRYRKFPLASMWSGLLSTQAQQVPILLLSALFSQQVVGYYSLSVRVVALPAAVIGQAVSQVFLQRASVAQHEGTLHVTVQSTFQRLVSLGLFPLLLLGLLGREVFVVVMGPQWTEAGMYTQILSIWQFFVFMSVPLSTVFTVLERQGAMLGFNVVLLTTRVLSLGIGAATANVYLALALYSVSGAVLYAWLMLWLLRLSAVSRRWAMREVGQVLLHAAPMLLLIAAAKWWWGLPTWGLLMLAILSTLIYYGLALRRDSTLQELLRRVWRK